MPGTERKKESRLPCNCLSFEHLSSLCEAETASLERLYRTHPGLRLHVRDVLYSLAFDERGVEDVLREYRDGLGEWAGWESWCYNDLRRALRKQITIDGLRFLRDSTPGS